MMASGRRNVSGRAAGRAAGRRRRTVEVGLRKGAAGASARGQRKWLVEAWQRAQWLTLPQIYLQGTGCSGGGQGPFHLLVQTKGFLIGGLDGEGVAQHPCESNIHYTE